MIQAIIFDFDGLILDTETPWYHVYYEVYKEHGVNLSLREWAEFVGTEFDALAYLEQRTGTTIDRHKIEKRTKEMHAALMQQMTIRPGVEQYLQTAKQLQMKLGLASSSPRNWVEGFLKKHRLYSYFDCIRTADDVTQVKPNPELYLQALAGLGVSAAQAMAFEDSVNGLKAAKGAGLRCVIVPNSVTACLSFEHYDLRISSMSELDLKTVIERISMEKGNTIKEVLT